MTPIFDYNHFSLKLAIITLGFLTLPNTKTSCQTIYFEDENFKAALIADHTINRDQDTIITIAEAIEAELVSISGKQISSLSGIEHFLNLKQLHCPNNEIEYIDLSANINLEILNCGGNDIEEVSLVNNTKLTHLVVRENKLSNLSLLTNRRIKQLSCERNNIQSLELKSCDSLEILWCQYNSISE